MRRAQFRYVRRDGVGNLVGAAMLFALATITRNTGTVFLVLPVGAALLDRRHSLLAGTRRAAFSGAAALLILLAAMGWNAARHGNFEMGSWNGISLLTKSLPLVEPGDQAGLPPPVAAVVPYAEKAEALIAAQPDAAARLRAHVQAVSSDLRWGVFIPDAETSWPAWQEADWNNRGKLAGEVSLTLIGRHPLGMLSLWAQDWLVLVLQPAYWPASMTTQTPDTGEFVACGRDHNCWALQRYDIPARNRLVLFIASLAGPAVALLVLVLDGPLVLRRRAGNAIILYFLMALVIHATLLGMSAFEAGGSRFTVAVHVLELPLLIWVAARFGRWLQSRGSRSDWARYRTNLSRRGAI